MYDLIFLFIDDLRCSERDEGSGSDLGSRGMHISLCFF